MSGRIGQDVPEVSRALGVIVIGVVLVAGCGHGGPRGVVDGSFRLPGRQTADLQRGGLNFSTSVRGDRDGHTTKVGADGQYTVTLPPGSYSVIGGLSGQRGGPAPESCAETMSVVVTANSTTHADFVCHATPVSAP